MPIFIKQIQCFANEHNLLCTEKLDFQTNARWFANTKLYLRKNAEVWTNICIVCYNCETHLPFYEETWLDFLTRVRADFLTRAIEQLSYPKTADGAVGQFTLVSRDPKHLFTFSDQYEWGTGEFLSSVNFIEEDDDEKYSSTNLFSVTKTRRWRAKTNIWW